MKNYTHRLETYKGRNTRHTCPQCGHRYTFTRYINTQTGAQVHTTVGRCNREHNCGYHYTPRQYFTDNNIASPRQEYKMLRFTQHDRHTTPPDTYKAPEQVITYIPHETLKASLETAQDNHFISYLNTLFGKEKASELTARYFIGTSAHWKGATVFWQVDVTGKIRAGKIMLYNPSTGRRVKEPYNHITWVAHTGVMAQCLFGEHLLHNNTKPVAIVESEKTAIIASAYLPAFTWLATGSLSNLNADKCRALQGRRVTLFPDLNAYDKWMLKAQEMGIAGITVSDLLECNAGAAERQQSFDLADYLVKFNCREFDLPQAANKVSHQLNELTPIEQPEKPAGAQLKEEQWTTALTKLEERFGCSRSPFFTPANTAPALTTQQQYKRDWENEVAELTVFFAHAELPTYPVKIDVCTTITDMEKCVEGHLACLRTYAGNKTFLPYLERLRELKGWVVER